MTARLIVRRDDGSVQSIPMTRGITIGTAQDNDVRVDGDDVLPCHAKAGIEGNIYWIRNAGDAGVAVNGRRIAEKQTLRHLDVISIGSTIDLIFSTSEVATPPPVRAMRPQTARAPLTVSPPDVAVVIPRAELSSSTAETPVAANEGDRLRTVAATEPVNRPVFEPAAGSPDPENTIMGPRAGVMPVFRPGTGGVDPENTIVGPRADVIPVFRPDTGDVDPENTVVGRRADVMPVFRPTGDADPENTIMGPRKPGVAPRFQAPDRSEGENTITAGRNAIPVFKGSDREEKEPQNTAIEPINAGAPPTLPPTPSVVETVANAPASASPSSSRISRSRKPMITGVRLIGPSGVLIGPLGRSVIGRGSAATIRIDSDEVSKIHASVDVSSTEVIVTDQNSANGTWVNGARLTAPRRLVEGDRVAFATREYRVECIRAEGGE